MFSIGVLFNFHSIFLRVVEKGIVKNEIKPLHGSILKIASYVTIVVALIVFIYYILALLTTGSNIDTCTSLVMGAIINYPAILMAWIILPIRMKIREKEEFVQALD